MEVNSEYLESMHWVQETFVSLDFIACKLESHLETSPNDKDAIKDIIDIKKAQKIIYKITSRHLLYLLDNPLMHEKFVNIQMNILLDNREP